MLFANWYCQAYIMENLTALQPLTSMPVIYMMIINGGQKGHITGFTGLSIAVLSHGFQVEIRTKITSKIVHNKCQ